MLITRDKSQHSHSNVPFASSHTCNYCTHVCGWHTQEIILAAPRKWSKEIIRPNERARARCISREWKAFAMKFLCAGFASGEKFSLRRDGSIPFVLLLFHIDARACRTFFAPSHPLTTPLNYFLSSRTHAAPSLLILRAFLPHVQSALFIYGAADRISPPLQCHPALRSNQKSSRLLQIQSQRWRWF
jgi:hypothetical protein